MDREAFHNMIITIILKCLQLTNQISSEVVYVVTKCRYPLSDVDIIY